MKNKSQKLKRIVIFDLDETIIDSSHRTPNNPDGTLNLTKYLELKTRENTMKDTLLPLSKYFQNLSSENYIVVCTARTWKDFDEEFLMKNNLIPDMIFARSPCGKHNKYKDANLKAAWISRLRNLKQFKNLPIFMFDDAKPVISAMRKLGIICLNSHKVNKRIKTS